VCSAVAILVCAWEEGGVRVFMRWGWVLCCAWVVVPLPVGLVLFVGVLVGDVRRFVVSFFPWWGVHLPQSHPLPLHRFRARSGPFSCVFFRVCVLFARWGGEASLPPLCVDMRVHLFCCTRRWHPRPCLAVWGWTSCDRCPPSRPRVDEELAWRRAPPWACW
jgi:hypothetical protein